MGLEGVMLQEDVRGTVTLGKMFTSPVSPQLLLKRVKQASRRRGVR